MQQSKQLTPAVITNKPSHADHTSHPSGEIVTGIIGSACGVIGTLIGESLAKLLERKCAR